MDKTETLLSKGIETSVGNCKETGNTILSRGSDHLVGREDGIGVAHTEGFLG